MDGTRVPRNYYFQRKIDAILELKEFLVSQNGVRGLMLDMYDFRNDIWLCHSYGGACRNFTAFVTKHQPNYTLLGPIPLVDD